MSIEANKALIATYHQELWGKGDKSAIDRYWAPDAEVHFTGFTGSAIEVVKADVERYFGAYTDVETRIDNLVGEGDKVVLHWTTTGLHVGLYGDVPATHRVITMTGMDLFTITDARISACWSMWDGLSVYEQLGTLSISPPGSGA